LLEVRGEEPDGALQRLEAAAPLPEPLGAVQRVAQRAVGEGGQHAEDRHRDEHLEQREAAVATAHRRLPSPGFSGSPSRPGTNSAPDHVAFASPGTVGSPMKPVTVRMTPSAPASDTSTSTRYRPSTPVSEIVDSQRHSRPANVTSSESSPTSGTTFASLSSAILFCPIQLA